MAGPRDLDLDPDEIIAAAIEIIRERGLDAVSMRKVAERLGVSPMPLYTRVGNKQALISAVSDQLLSDLAPPATRAEAWPEYASRWCGHLRGRLASTPDSRLFLGSDRDAYVAASVPLIEALRAAGLTPGEAVQACRLLMWGTVGFVAMEQGSTPPAAGRTGGPSRVPARVSGGNPTGVTPAEADELFELHIGFLISGLQAMHAG